MQEKMLYAVIVCIDVSEMWRSVDLTVVSLFVIYSFLYFGVQHRDMRGTAPSVHTYKYLTILYHE